MHVYVLQSHKCEHPYNLILLKKLITFLKVKFEPQYPLPCYIGTIYNEKQKYHKNDQSISWISNTFVDMP